jgi:hypothetical protein
MSIWRQQREDSSHVSSIHEKQIPIIYTQAGLINNFPPKVSKKMIETLAKDDPCTRNIINEAFSPERGFPGKVDP